MQRGRWKKRRNLVVREATREREFTLALFFFSFFLSFYLFIFNLKKSLLNDFLNSIISQNSKKSKKISTSS